MADLQKFTVLRRHIGDRIYDVGEVREGVLNDLRHLVPRVLIPLENKAEGAAPANKAKSPAATGKGKAKAEAATPAEDAAPEADPAALADEAATQADLADKGE